MWSEKIAIGGFGNIFGDIGILPSIIGGSSYHLSEKGR